MSTKEPVRTVILGPEWGLPTVSPFGLKLVTWLRLAGIEHVVEHENNTQAGPKKKSPWIVWKGERVGDTELIIERLTRELRVDPDAHLTPFQRATGLAIRRMFEEHFNFSHMHDLFITEEGWRHMRPHFDFLPAPVRPFLAPYIRSAVRKEVYAQGLGRHERAEIDAMAAADLDAAAALLGDQPFFLGDQATLTDCSAFGFLGMTLWWPVRSASREHLASQPGLVGFCERMRDRLWPELSY